jgi:putative MFS transporter
VQGETVQSAIGARIDGLTSWKVRYWAPLVLGLIMLGDSWDISVIGYVIPSLTKEWKLDPVTVGAVASAGYAGQFIGSLVLGAVAERVGRMPVIHVAIVTMCALSLACVFTHDPQTFLALRFLEGLALGGAFPASISYVNELAPTQTRGRYFSIFQFIMVSGYSLSSIAAPFVIPRFGWRAMFVLGATPALLIPLIMLTLPESPRWLGRLGRVDAANKALLRLGSQTVDAGLAMAREQMSKVPVAALFAPEYRARTIVVCLLWFCTSLISFAFSTWATTLYVQVFHAKLQDALTYAAIASFVILFIPLVFAAIIDGLGRRGPAIACGLMGLAALLALQFVDHFNIAGVVALITTSWVMAAAGTIVLWPYSAEVFPTEIRATALGLTSSLARGASMLTPVVLGGTLALTGSIRGVFGLMAACALIVTLVWWRFTQETARKTLEEIAEA